MAELSGTLASIGLTPLLRLLTELHKSGRLIITDGTLSGALFFDYGRVVGAVCELEKGLESLDAIVLALGDADFEFDEHVGERQLNLVMEPNELEQHMLRLAEERAELARLLPSSMLVPRVTDDDADQNGELVLSRRALRLLLAIDGRRRVADLAAERGLVPTMRQLAELANLGLIQFDAPEAEPAPQPLRARQMAARPLERAPEAARGSTEPVSARPATTRRPRGIWPGWRTPTVTNARPLEAASSNGGTERQGLRHRLPPDDPTQESGPR